MLIITQTVVKVGTKIDIKTVGNPTVFSKESEKNRDEELGRFSTCYIRWCRVVVNQRRTPLRLFPPPCPNANIRH